MSDRADSDMSNNDSLFRHTAVEKTTSPYILPSTPEKPTTNWTPPQTPYLAVDSVVWRMYEGKIQIVLIERAWPPLGFALPGGFVNIGETITSTCAREAREELTLEVNPVAFVGYWDDPQRDPRRHVVTIAWLCDVVSGQLKAGDDAKMAAWHNLDDVLDRRKTNLVLGHHAIVKKAAGTLHDRLVDKSQRTE